ncbi:hypothetical protein ACLESD_06575 [Pyxidicoccus sp. 3LFB2]
MRVLRPVLKRCLVVLGLTFLSGCGPEVERVAPEVESQELALLPTGWTGANIGTTGGVSDSSAGVITMTSTGDDISGTADGFGFVYRSLSGNGEVLARVASQGSATSDAWAKTGVMIRESLAAGSRHAFMGLTPGNGARFKFRDVTGGSSPTSLAGPVVTAPYWVKLVRSGSTFSGFVSQNGIIWTQVASATVPMTATTVYYGLANTPHTATGSITSTFSGYRVVSTAASYPGDKGGGELGPEPTGYPRLAYAASPLSSDTTFAGFLTRAGMSKRWGESEAQPEPEIVTVNGRRAIRIWAAPQTRGSNTGLLIQGFPNSGPSGVPGGPRNSIGRVKVLWPQGYSFYPVGPDGENHADYGGIKAAGFWGGNTPATGDDFGNDGWALTIWTGKWASTYSNNYVALGQDLNWPRDGAYASPAIWRDVATNELWKVENHQGEWVQLEWEHRIETTAGGLGTLRFWINGVKGIDKQVRYFSADDFSANNNQGALAGVKGIYLRNFWGGSGRAPQKTPVYYTDLEVWTQ